MSMVRKVLLLLPVALISIQQAFAQLGTIKGTVKDALTGEPVIGANVIVAGAALGTTVDINGEFEIGKVKAGEHTVIVSFISYKTDTLQGVVVYPDQTTLINHKMMEESLQLGEVV